MSDILDVVVLVGSLREGSWTRKVAKAMMTLAPPTLRGDFVDFSRLPHYNQDLDTTSPPSEWVTFRDRIRPADAVLFVTPEYNRSVPGALKNAIDVASRPYGKGVVNGKPAGVVSVSPGALGGFGANHHLRQMLVFLDMPTLQQPEMYIGGADKLFDANGQLVNEGTKQFLGKFMQTFADWIPMTSKKRA